MKLKKGDTVVMRAGRDQGKSGQIGRILPARPAGGPASAQVLVEGLNVVKRHTKPSAKQPKGGILEIAKPIAVGKVALVCPNCKQPTRVGWQLKGEAKERVCRKCQRVIK